MSWVQLTETHTKLGAKEGKLFLYAQGCSIELKCRELNLMRYRIWKLQSLWFQRLSVFLKPVVCLLYSSLHVFFFLLTLYSLCLHCHHTWPEDSFLKMALSQIYITILISNLQFTNWSFWDLVSNVQEREIGWPRLGQINTCLLILSTSGREWEQCHIICCLSA